MTSNSADSPLSPRVRKALAKHRLVEESKSKPVLLQELHEYLERELGELNAHNRQQYSTELPQQHVRNVALPRLQVFQHVFQRIIDAFSVFAPLLSQIKDEYERVLAHLLSQSHLVPQLQSELQSIQTQCLREISAHNVEMKMKCQRLKNNVKLLQGQLTAQAAEKAKLTHANAQLTQQNDRLEKRMAEMAMSNNSLVNGMKRHDETLRYIHEQSREDSIALQQVTIKYHRACEEIAELKKTISALEEKVGGVHVSADKATIALLTKELQDLHAKYTRLSSATAEVEEENKYRQQALINDVFVKALEHHNVTVDLQQLADIVVPNGAANAAGASGSRSVASGGGGSGNITFLTEPDEVVPISATVQLKLSMFAPNEFIQGRGTSLDIPEYLQLEGAVRNLYFPRKRVEQIVMRVWQQKDDMEKVNKRNPNSQAAMPLAKVFTLYLSRSFGHTKGVMTAEAIEVAYNVVAALERYSKVSSDCRLFTMILDGELPEDARQDQIKELYTVHDALFALDREQKSSHVHPPGRLPLADVIQTLRMLFPWKTNEALGALYRSLLVDLRGSPFVDYAALLLQQDEKRMKPRSAVSECLRAQYIDDLLTFRRHLQTNVERALSPVVNPPDPAASASPAGETPQTAAATTSAPAAPNVSERTAPETAESRPSSALSGANENGHGMISLHALRDCLQACDPAKPVQDINRVLSEASGLTVDQILAHDSVVINGAQFVNRLKTILIKPSGKFK
ncbi:TPA: hypothetical protein N0F65_013028 [Lagenidium giganteum]|uniref:Translin-associated factor X-interacting protein 1 N-terminal domain-containing protein n=1 Tax=Lagenidium giganteum TaxID=4803 RepID=A0AAV2YPA6_9STRA|nr:TPA: hypothetical protein N0F65_013028 [Lagenidium giganteum]